VSITTTIPKSSSNIASKTATYKFGAGTTPTTNKNSRTGSEEKNIFKAILSKEKFDIKSSVKLSNNTSATGNKSITNNTSIQFNTKSTSKSKPMTKQMNTSVSINNASSNINGPIMNTPVETENSTKPHFNNLLNTNNLKLVNVTSPKDSGASTNKNSTNILLKKKSVPISVCVTSQVSKNTSKNNSKSSSRIDDKTELMRKKIIETENKKLMQNKKHQTSTNSPSHQHILFNKGGSSSNNNNTNNKSLSIKKLTEGGVMNNTVKTAITKKYTIKTTKKDSLENLLDLSTTSVRSTIRESNHYKHEAEKVSDFIRRFYEKHHSYPDSNIKMYKIGRVSFLCLIL
jgi:hypothetical protein